MNFISLGQIGVAESDSFKVFCAGGRSKAAVTQAGYGRVVTRGLRHASGHWRHRQWLVVMLAQARDVEMRRQLSNVRHGVRVESCKWWAMQ